jgi:hypothetical protein
MSAMYFIRCSEHTATASLSAIKKEGSNAYATNQTLTDIIKDCHGFQ